MSDGGRSGVEGGAGARRRAPRHAWGRERRLAFIEFRLLWEGRVNRRDLQDFFGISAPQASTDLQHYVEIQGDGAAYDASAKAYVPTARFAPRLVPHEADGYLHELLARASGFTDPESSFIAWMPPLGIVPMPHRTVRPRHLVDVLHGIRAGRALELRYQSTTQPEPTWRTISPHALASDGLRWHVRAWCHERRDFRDFVVGRILETGGTSESPVRGDDDRLWHQWVTVAIGAHRQLPEGSRRAIEVDYGMTDGEVRIPVRAALLFYLFQRLGLPGSGWDAPPGVRQLELRNEGEIRDVMERVLPAD